MTQDQPQRPEQNSKLTHRQYRAIECLVMSKTIADAARKAGVGRATLYRWLKDPAFRAAYERRLAETLSYFKEQTREFLIESLDDLEAQLRSPDPQLRMQADKTIMDFQYADRSTEEA